MAITGITFAETQPFYSEHDDAPEAEKTEFLIGAIDATVRGMIGENSIAWLQTENGTQMINKQSSRDFDLCRFGVKGWSKFRDAKGSDIEFKQSVRIVNGKAYQVVDDEVLNKVPPIVIGEMAAKIIEINTATDTLRKK
jgi:hypothetical protein